MNVAEPNQESDPYDEQFRLAIQACADLWNQTRQRVARETGSDGEGRRAADLARAQCEEPLWAEKNESVAVTADTRPLAPECRKPFHPAAAGPESLVESVPSDVVRVFWTGCNGEMVILESGAFDAMTSTQVTVDVTDIAEALNQVFETWAQGGPGYFDQPIEVPELDLRGDHLVVSFSKAFDAMYDFPTTGQIEGVVSEIAANAFQFAILQSIEITIEGDCDEFWGGTPYGYCRTVTREGISQ